MASEASDLSVAAADCEFVHVDSGPSERPREFEW